MNDDTIYELEISSQEAEQSLLGGLLVEPDKMVLVADRLRPDHFRYEDNEHIYRAMLELHQRGDEIDTVTLFDSLEGAGNGEGAMSLTGYMANVPTGLHVETYAKIVLQRAIRRSLVAYGGKVAQIGHKPTNDDPETLLAKVQTRLDAIGNAYTPDRGPRLFSDIAQDVYDEIEEAYNNKAPIGLTTGLTSLNAWLNGGLQRGDLVILAARPSMGKTALATHIALSAAEKQAARVLMFSLEMADKSLARRVLAVKSKIDTRRMTRAKIRNDEWEGLHQSLRDGEQLQLWIDDTAALNASQIRGRANRIMAKHGLDLIIVDFLSIMGSEDPKRASYNMHQEISQRVQALKNLAKELDIPVLVLSQLNRSVEARADKQPMLSDLRESGSIEEAADVVMFIYRDDYYNPESEYPNLAEIILAKQRNGQTGSMSVYFRKELTQFLDLEIKEQRLD
jgi:replicative DNA helicase